MTAFCKTRVPQEMWDELLPIKEDDEAVKNWGIHYMTKLCRSVRVSVHACVRQWWWLLLLLLLRGPISMTAPGGAVSSHPIPPHYTM